MSGELTVQPEARASFFLIDIQPPSRVKSTLLPKFHGMLRPPLVLLISISNIIIERSSWLLKAIYLYVRFY